MPSRRTVIQKLGSLPLALAALPSSGQADPKRPALHYLQIGTGHAHANKLEVYAASPDWEVVGIVEEDPELREAARSHRLYSAYPLLSLEEGLRLPGLQVVGVETRVRDLLRYAHLAVEAGCHVHLDKPAGASLEDYRSLLERADRAGRVVQMGYMYRFNPAVQMLRRVLQAGWLGEVFEVHAVMSKVIPPRERQVLDEFAGGTMFELGCHLIDLVVGVLGRPERVVPFPRRTLDLPEDQLVDNMLAVLEYPKATATVRTTGLEVEGGARRQFTVCGTEGSFHIQPLDRPKAILSLSQERRAEDGTLYPKGITTIPFEPPYRRYVGDAAELAALVRGERANPYPSSHDLAVQETVLLASGMSGA